MKFEVFNIPVFEKRELEKSLKKIFPEEDFVVNVVFVSKEKIRKLNQKLRDKDEVTDVLSFTVSPEVSEIYLCPEYIKKNSDDFEKEVLRMIVHGILHIKGYEHKHYFDEKNLNEEMFFLQERFLKKICDILEK